MQHIVAEAGDIIGSQINDRRQLLQQRFHIGDFAGDHLQAIEGDVLYQRDTVAIEDEPAARGNRQHFDIVLVRAGLIEIVLFDLQPIEVNDQNAKADHHQNKSHHGPANKQHLFR